MLVVKGIFLTFIRCTILSLFVSQLKKLTNSQGGKLQIDLEVTQDSEVMLSNTPDNVRVIPA